MAYFVYCHVWMPFLSKRVSIEQKKYSTLTYGDIYLCVSYAKTLFLLPELILIGVCSSMHKCRHDVKPEGFTEGLVRRRNFVSL